MEAHERARLQSLVDRMSVGQHRDQVFVARDLSVQDVIVELATLIAGVDEQGRSLQRPPNYAELTPAEQWEIDKSLGILDWDGVGR